MGKGGCTLVRGDVPLMDETNTKSTERLEQERNQKIKAQPKFYWTHEGEPHRHRKQAILAKHPTIKKYMGPIDPSTKYKVSSLVALQLLSLHLLQGAPWYIWVFCCYTLSGSVNHSMTLAIHELSHNLGAKGIIKNRFLAILANLPMGVPAAASFKRYHVEHHRFQGEDILDVDVPTELEGWFFNSAGRKVLWCLLQPLFYSLRPLMTNPKQPTKWEFINMACVIAFDIIILYVWGIGGLLYLVVGTLLGMGLHPVAGHFIAEHYVMNKGQETYSYYGPLNWLTFNVGYHNEHHDFPNVSANNLPDLRRIAPESYDGIPHFHSWVKVMWDYVFDDEISPYSRMKRVTVTNDEAVILKARGGLLG